MPCTHALRRWFSLAACAAALTSWADGAALPQLTYSPGGRVIDRVHVVPVMWTPDVAGDVKVRIVPFYKAAVTSSFFDFLNEYSTVRQYGSQQTIGPGTADEAITITPANRSPLLSEKDVASELSEQIVAGALPMPDANTLYMVHFPLGIGLTVFGAQDCSDGAPKPAFCAYHYASKVGGKVFRFGAMPDFTAGGCRVHCGTLTSSAFEIATIVSSHELFEAITNPDATAFAWYDRQSPDAVSDHGEIGDVCANVLDESATIVSAAGESFRVQREWSNTYSGCIVSKDDAFPLKLSSAKLGVAPGSSVSFTATLGKPTTTPEQLVTVVLRGLSAGLTATVQPPRVQTGQTAEITITAPAGVSPTSLQLEVLAAGQRATIFSALSLVVQPDTLLVSLPTPSATLSAGGSTALEVKTINTGNAKQVALSVAGLPEGVSGEFDPPVVAAGATSTLTLTASATAKAGADLGFTVTGTAGALSSSAVGSLTIATGGCSSTGGVASWLAVVLLALSWRRRALER